MTQRAAQIGLQRTRATIARATAFLGNGLAMPGSVETLTIAGPHRAKVIGNGLREIDRFLNLLIDEIARTILPSDAQPAFERQRNTANKVHRLQIAMLVPAQDCIRLRAIGRSRDCLFHCGGIVRRGDRRGDPFMTVGWGVGRVAIGDRLLMDVADLTDVCGYYDGLVASLLDGAADHR